MSSIRKNLLATALMGAAAMIDMPAQDRYELRGRRNKVLNIVQKDPLTPKQKRARKKAKVAKKSRVINQRKARKK